MEENSKKSDSIDLEGLKKALELFTKVLQQTTDVQQCKVKGIDSIKNDFRKLIEELTKSSKEFNINQFISKLDSYLEKNKRLLYSEFTSIIIEMNKSSDNDHSVGTLISNLENCIEYVLKENNEISENIQKTLIKLWDHANLASNQYNYFVMTDGAFVEKVKPILEPKISELKDEYSDLSDQVKVAKKNLDKSVDEVKNTKFKIVSDIIALISIFVAISFVMFGGMTLLNNLFDFTNMSHIPITELLCLGALTGLILITIIYAFMIFVLKLLDKPYKDKPIFNRILISMVVILTGICICSFICWNHDNDYVTNKNDTLNNNIQIEEKQNDTNIKNEKYNAKK